MRQFLFVSVLLCLAYTLPAQVPSDYFQQRTDYEIAVTLDDELHRLSGTTDIAYTNHSPDTLKEIYLHLWPNAYRNRRTAFAVQKLENGDQGFQNAPTNQLGGYKEIDIKVNDKVVEWDYWEDNPDIALLVLSRPLPPGGKLTINTEFLLKIPASFSRLGHVGQSYQMTQWYPKPAVYDKAGWHPMPYLDQGEFYSEFGDFDVRITLPANYVVGATGELQTVSELRFLAEKVEETRRLIELGSMKDVREVPFPASDSITKTIHYTAADVHDFAWFADKRFHVNQDVVSLPSGKKVDTYVMFTDQQSDKWAKAIDYVNRSVEFYSEKVGEYPYPHATAVQSALSAGAGMEYPMITVIGLAGSDRALDEVITHEVGHNWFYGILASNERDHAWMDEGFNSYYEHEYMEEYYPKGGGNGLARLAGTSPSEIGQLGMALPARRRTDQAVNTPSQDLRLLNYWIGAYEKPAMLLDYLENYLGQDAYDALLRKYYDTWKFKHPQPADVRALFEAETGKDLSWFFDGLINSADYMDYKMKSVSWADGICQVTVKNVGEVAGPFPIDVIEEGEVVETVWVDGFEGEQVVDIKLPGADKLVIDHYKITPELYRKNNTIRSGGGKMEPLRLKFLSGAESGDRSDLYWAPIMAFNKYDGFMAGLLLHNIGVPSKRFEWAVAPMYALRSKDVAGVATARYHFYPEKLQRVTAGLGYKGFSYSENDFYTRFGESADFDYHRLRPYVELEFKKKRARAKFSHTLTAQTLLTALQGKGSISTEIIGMDTMQVYSGHEYDLQVVPQLHYRYGNRSGDVFKATLEGQSYTNNRDERAGYLKLLAEGRTAFTYQKNKAFYIRGFAGVFLFNTQRNAGGVSDYRIARGSISLIDQGGTDYNFDGYYFGRAERTGITSQQAGTGQGAFKLPYLEGGGLGQSNSFAFAVNIKGDLPMQYPSYLPAIRPYADLGFFLDSRPTADGKTFNDGLMVSGGIALEFLGERIGIYFPLVGTGNVMNTLKQRGKYRARITFSLDLNRMNPADFAYYFDL